MHGYLIIIRDFIVRNVYAYFNHHKMSVVDST